MPGANDAMSAAGYGKQDMIALLLPQSGRYAGAAQAVRDGIFAARSLGKQGNRPEVRLYDSSDPASVPGLLKQAAADGATLAIGPLQKASVSALAGSTALPIPTLALNRAAMDAVPANLYQFSLSPEDEAAEAANKAWNNGYRTALMFYPAGGWGDRISSGFRRQWEALGGQVVAERRYKMGAGDQSGSVSGLFADAGGASAADFLFLVTTAKEGRSLWPQIQAAGGAGMPVISTSHIYGGSFYPADDRSLIGLQFVDIPWLLAPDSSDPLSREQLQISLSGLEGKFTRLYAMGIDAYDLAPRVSWMADRPGAFFDGRTGRLTLDTRRQVRRELVLARMDAAGPVRITSIDHAPGAIMVQFSPAALQGTTRVASLRP
jgi:outer membrane PBP1 activator LpoA protein